jgi:hypothetical protein
MAVGRGDRQSELTHYLGHGASYLGLSRDHTSGAESTRGLSVGRDRQSFA